MAYAKSEETRRRFLASTSRLLRTRGYSATGLSDIVADSGLPKGSLYHQFPGGKEQLAAESIQHSGMFIRANLEQLVERSGGPIEAVVAFCDYYVEQLKGSAYRSGCPLATVALEAASDVDALQVACSNAFDGVLDVLGSELRVAGLREAEARSLATFVVSAIEGALILAKAQRDTAALIQVRDHVAASLRLALNHGEST